MYFHVNVKLEKRHNSCW